MKYLSETEIFNIIQESNDNEISKSIEIDDSTKQLFFNYYSNLKKSFTVNSYESILTTNKIVPWINPMLFHKNLNLAIDALMGFEKLEEKELGLTSYMLANNFYESSIENDDGNIDKHKKLLKNDNVEEILRVINYRKIKKIFDLLEYSKASKLGGKIIYGIENIYNSDLKLTHRIREDLRNLLLESKRLELKRQEVIIPVSAKYTKDDDDNFIVKDLETVKYEDYIARKYLLSSISSEYLIFNLTNHPILKRLDNSQLLRVGVEVIDDFACKRNLPISEKWGKSYWNFELEDHGNGFNLSETIDDKHNIKKTIFTNVPGGKDEKIVWSNNESLININCNREWKINLLGNCLTGHHNIKDIILHFHISYIN